VVKIAGIGRDAPLTETTIEPWRSLTSVNLKAVFLGMNHALQLIQKAPGRKHRQRVFAGEQGVHPNMGAYCSSETGVKARTMVAALESALGQRTRCESTGCTRARLRRLVGPTRRPFWRRAWSKPDLTACGSDEVPIGFMGTPLDHRLRDPLPRKRRAPLYGACSRWRSIGPVRLDRLLSRHEARLSCLVR